MSSQQITTDGQVKSGGATDGARLYFAKGGQLYQVSKAGGEIVPLPQSTTDLVPFDISRDRSQLLVLTAVRSGRRGGLDSSCFRWLAPPIGQLRRYRCILVSGRKHVGVYIGKRHLYWESRW